MADKKTNEFEFEGTIEAGRGGGAFVRVPFDTVQAFGTARSIRVIARYDGFEANSNIVSMGDGPVVGVHKATRKAIAKGVGDHVHIQLREDTRPRVVQLPAELKAAFDGDPAAGSRYQGLSFTHRREFASWVGGAKKPETRARRATRAVEMILSGQHL